MDVGVRSASTILTRRFRITALLKVKARRAKAMTGDRKSVV
jgi:hypothetical protein